MEKAENVAAVCAAICSEKAQVKINSFNSLSQLTKYSSEQIA